jgi:4-hydroxybutyrate CoA-transferase
MKMTWSEEEYKRKFISPEQVAQMVKSGDRLAFTMGREAFACGMAISARKEELKDVKIYAATPTFDFGWYDAGWEDSFAITISVPTATCQEAIDNHRCDIWAAVPIEKMEPDDIPDILLTEVSPPDAKGFCSFGSSLWNKKRQIQKARQANKVVIAEVNSNLIRTYGDNFIHYSEIDYFVEHISSGHTAGSGSLAGRALKEPERYLKDIAGYVNGLIRDGDTIQIGVGRTTEPLVKLGMFKGKHDIGFHSEATPPGIISLVEEGVINGRLKTLHPGKVIATSLGGSTQKEMDWVNMNPLFWLVDVDYLEDIRVIAANDNMTAINNALTIDLSGQITAQGMGTQILSAPGGQQPFVFGAWLSKGGRPITVLPSTARNGTVSRIVPFLPPGTSVTIPSSYTYYVVTEYGIANLRGKTSRQRAEELISIAHPDFRAELKKEAKRLWG